MLRKLVDQLEQDEVSDWIPLRETVVGLVLVGGGILFACGEFGFAPPEQGSGDFFGLFAIPGVEEPEFLDNLFGFWKMGASGIKELLAKAEVIRKAG